MPAQRESGGGVMEGACPRGAKSDLCFTRIPGGERHPGFRERVALRGATQERGPWSVREDGGNIQPAVRRADDPKGCPSSSSRGGEPSPSSFCGSRRRAGGSFAQRYSAHAVQRCRPTAIAANGGRIEASPASGVPVGGWLSRSRFAACLQRRRAGFGRAVAVRSARGPSSRGEGRQALNKHGENERRFDVTATRPGARDASKNARTGCSGVCPCVGSQLQKSLGGSRIQRSACRRLA